MHFFKAQITVMFVGCLIHAFLKEGKNTLHLEDFSINKKRTQKQMKKSSG